jgi:hypothetical protein
VNRSDPARNQSEDAASEPRAAFSARMFGRRKADLDFDFSTDDRPRLVTEILAACMFDREGAPLESERAWSMPVSRRIEWLIRLASASRAFASRLPVRCPRGDCRELSEIDLPLDEVFNLQRRAEGCDLTEWRDDSTVLRLRRPTGRDQRDWRSASFGDELEARRGMFDALVAGADGALPDAAPALIETIDDLLAEFDPLVAFSVRIACPHCEVETDFPIDLQAHALSELEKIQRQLIQTVHRLAVHYHWSEAEILDLTPERRARYLRLIEAEEAA